MSEDSNDDATTRSTEIAPNNTTPSIPIYTLPPSHDVHLDVEYRQRLHALIPASSSALLQHVLLRVLGHSARALLSRDVAELFRSFLPFTLQSPASPSSDALSSLRPALQPSLRDFVRETERALRETAAFALTEQLDHLPAFIAEQEKHGAGHEDNAQPPDGESDGARERASSGVHSALARWLHRVVQHADRAQLLVMAGAFESPPHGAPSAPSSPALHPLAAAFQPDPSSSASSAPSSSSMRSSEKGEHAAAAATMSAAQADVLCVGGVEALCVVLSYLSFSELVRCTALVSRRFFSASLDPRCWRLLRGLRLFSCPPPPLLALSLHKALQLRRLSFPRSALDEHVAALGREDVDADASTESLLLSPYLTHLTSLDLSDCLHLTDDAFRSLTRPSSPHHDNPALAVLARLEHVNVSGCGALTDAAFLALFPCLPALRSLRVANVGRIGLPSFAALSAHCPLLTSLDASSCRSVNDAAIKQLCALPALRELSVTACWALTAGALHVVANHCAHITALDLSGCPSAATDLSIRPIALSCHQLRRICLRGCAVSDAGMDVLARGCRLLEEVDLGGVSGGGQVSGEFTDRTLVSLSKFTRGLRSLVLGASTAVTDRGVLTLGLSCPALTSLTLTQCGQLTSLALVYLGDSPAASSLTVLNVSLCHRVDDHGVCYVLSKCPRLTSLRTAQCVGVTDRALLFLGKTAKGTAEGAGALCAVRELDLLRCPITDRGLMGLTRGREGAWGGLEVLLLANCGRVTDEGTTAFAALCPRLRRLSLYGCGAITDDTCRALGRRCSQRSAAQRGSPPRSRHVAVTLTPLSCCAPLVRAAAGPRPQPLHGHHRCRHHGAVSPLFPGTWRTESAPSPALPSPC